MADESGVEGVDFWLGDDFAGGIFRVGAEDADDAGGGEDVEVVGEGLAAGLAGGGEVGEFAEPSALEPKEFEEFEKRVAFAYGEEFEDVAGPVGFDPFPEVGFEGFRSKELGGKAAVEEAFLEGGVEVGEFFDEDGLKVDGAFASGEGIAESCAGGERG